MAEQCTVLLLKLRGSNFPVKDQGIEGDKADPFFQALLAATTNAPAAGVFKGGGGGCWCGVWGAAPMGCGADACMAAHARMRMRQSAGRHSRSPSGGRARGGWRARERRVLTWGTGAQIRSNYALGTPHEGVHATEYAYKSKKVRQDLNPKFKTIAIDLQKLVNMDLQKTLLFDFYDWDRFSSPDFMSYIELTPQQLLDQHGKTHGLPLRPPPAPHEQQVGELWVDRAELAYPQVHISALSRKPTDKVMRQYAKWTGQVERGKSPPKRIRCSACTRSRDDTPQAWPVGAPGRRRCCLRAAAAMAHCGRPAAIAKCCRQQCIAADAAPRGAPPGARPSG